MKKSDLTGWREVFLFTFSQTVKQKAYGIFLAVFAVIALLYSPVYTLYNQYSDIKDTKASVGTVIIFDESGLEIEYKDVFTGKKYKNVEINSNPLKTIDEYEEQMKETADDTLLIKIVFDKEEKEYQILFIQGKNVGMSELSRVDFINEFCEYFDKARMQAANITEDKRDYVETGIVSSVKNLEEDGDIIDKEKDSISYNDYFIMLALMMVCMMLITISGNQIATSIVTEKSSRVIEYLVLNVRPLALIVGKLLATIVTSSLQMIAVGFCYMASPMLSNLITPTLSKWLFGAVESAQTSTSVADETLARSVQMIHGIKIEFVFLALIFIVLGIILFGIIAGLLGASISKMDEMQDAMALFQILLVFGCYADMALLVMQISGKVSPLLGQILSICPITSPFLVPCSMLLGNISWPLATASILVMVLAIVLLFMLTANVYEAMIFYNGKALKIKDILLLSSSKKKSLVKEEEKHEA